MQRRTPWAKRSATAESDATPGRQSNATRRAVVNHPPRVGEWKSNPEIGLVNVPRFIRRLFRAPYDGLRHYGVVAEGALYR